MNESSGFAGVPSQENNAVTIAKARCEERPGVVQSGARVKEYPIRVKERNELVQILAGSRNNFNAHK